MRIPIDSPESFGWKVLAEQLEINGFTHNYAGKRDEVFLILNKTLLPNFGCEIKYESNMPTKIYFEFIDDSAKTMFIMRHS